MYNILLNLTTKELHNYCLKYNININKNIVEKNKIINLIILFDFFNKFKKIKKKKICFLNNTNEEIFIYKDVQNIINSSNNYIFDLIKLNDISKFKFINEIKKKNTIYFKSLININYICGYNDNQGMFNILSYIKINNIHELYIINL